jgi:hypothetical protein
MRLALALVIALLTAGSASGQPTTSRTAEADEAAVHSVITDQFFGSISAFDYDALRRSVTPGFELVEDTLRLTMDGFIELLGPYEVWSLAYQLSDFNTRVSGPVAWTTYRNEGVARRPEQRVDFLWYETAVLEQVAREWRISRLHSTPVRPR